MNQSPLTMGARSTQNIRLLVWYFFASLRSPELSVLTSMVGNHSGMPCTCPRELGLPHQTSQYFTRLPTMTSAGFTLSSREPATPELMMRSGFSFKIMDVVATAALTLPMPAWHRTTSAVPYLPL